MKRIGTILLAFASVALSSWTEEFGSGWESRWVKTSNSKFTGVLTGTAGKFPGDAADQFGIQTSENARHYGYSAKFPAVNNDGKTLVLQYTVKHEQKLDCGGGYIKLLSEGADQSDFNNDSEYSIMFGPDMCGPSNRKIHLIFNYKGTNLLWKKTPPCKTDQLTHVYTMILNPDGTYQVDVDLEKVESGNLEDDWDFLKPKTIKDPAQSKPSDWVDSPKMDDPSDSKPADWDKPETIPDANAKKPDDWDEDDGEWSPPQVPNPEHKGTWRPKQIDNPAYKGPWVHPEIPNPDYVADLNLYKRGSLGVAAFELWQVTAGSIFDNIFVAVGDGAVADAKAHAEKHWKAHKDAEDKAFKDHEEAERKKADEQREKDEAERKAKEAASKKDNDDDDESDKKEEL